MPRGYPVCVFSSELVLVSVSVLPLALALVLVVVALEGVEEVVVKADARDGDPRLDMVQGA